MKKLLLLISLFLPGLLSAQNLCVPDNDRIIKEIIDPSSPYYYSPLMARYMKGDTTLTPTDYHYLYYGYAFQDTYSPLEPQFASDNMLMILEKSNNPDSSQCRKLIEYGNLAMKQDPLNPNTLNLMAYAQSLLGDTVAAYVNAIRVEMILSTIKASGNGLSEHSPWNVLAFSHANDLLASMDCMVAKRTVVSRSVEYIDIGVRDQRTKGFYFDFSRVYWQKPDKTPLPQKRGFEFNGIKLNKNK